MADYWEVSAVTGSIGRERHVDPIGFEPKCYTAFGLDAEEIDVSSRLAWIVP